MKHLLLIKLVECSLFSKVCWPSVDIRHLFAYYIQHLLILNFLLKVTVHTAYCMCIVFWMSLLPSDLYCLPVMLAR